jgi:hypothetical protein
VEETAMDNRYGSSRRESVRTAVAQILIAHRLHNRLDLFDQGAGQVTITIRDWDGRNHEIFEEAYALGEKLGFHVQAVDPAD